MRLHRDRLARRPRRCAFTLIELLVVVAVIALLIAIILPSFARARASAKYSVCMSNLNQIGAAVHVYAGQNADAIPRGPETPLPFHPQTWDQWASNQVWIGSLRAPNALGPLLTRDMTQPKALFCPADDSTDPIEELGKIERFPDQDAYSSYLYRQRDQTTRDRIDQLGLNDLNMPARALALDMNSRGSGPLERTNHAAAQVNILFLEGHVLRRKNTDDVLSIREKDYWGFPDSVERRLNEIVVAADYSERDDPTHTPPLP